MKYLHGPLAAEQAGVKGCVMCHTPAGAQCTSTKGGDFSLKEKELCSTCHERGTGTQHSVETPQCLSCHNPHASDTNSTLLRPGKEKSQK